jgi:hypothetical protein
MPSMMPEFAIGIPRRLPPQLAMARLLALWLSQLSGRRDIDTRSERFQLKRTPSHHFKSPAFEEGGFFVIEKEFS